MYTKPKKHDANLPCRLKTYQIQQRKFIQHLIRLLFHKIDIESNFF